MDLIILDNVPIPNIVGRVTLKRLRKVQGVKAEEVRMKYRRQKAIVPMLSEYTPPRAITGKTDSEDFTLESCGKLAKEDAEANKQLDEGLVLMIWDDCSARTKDFSKVDLAAIIKTKLSHMSGSIARQIKNALFVSNFNPYYLHDLSSANLSARHLFELTDDEPVYHQERRVASRHTQIIREELNMVL